MAFDLLGTPHASRSGVVGEMIDFDGRVTNPGIDLVAVARREVADLRARLDRVEAADQIDRSLAEAGAVDEPTDEIRRLRRYETCFTVGSDGSSINSPRVVAWLPDTDPSDHPGPPQGPAPGPDPEPEPDSSEAKAEASPRTVPIDRPTTRRDDRARKAESLAGRPDSASSIAAGPDPGRWVINYADPTGSMFAPRHAARCLRHLH